MDNDAVERALKRLSSAGDGRSDPAATEATLERARTQVEALALAAAELQTALPERVGNAVRDGVRSEALPVARQVAEVRGLMNNLLGRMERLDGDVLTERHARVDDLALLVDLITSGWRSVDDRLARIEKTLESSGGAIVYRIEERRPEPRPAVEPAVPASSHFSA